MTDWWYTSINIICDQQTSLSQSLCLESLYLQKMFEDSNLKPDSRRCNSSEKLSNKRWLSFQLQFTTVLTRTVHDCNSISAGTVQAWLEWFIVLSLRHHQHRDGGSRRLDGLHEKRGSPIGVFQRTSSWVRWWNGCWDYVDFSLLWASLRRWDCMPAKTKIKMEIQH